MNVVVHQNLDDGVHPLRVEIDMEFSRAEQGEDNWALSLTLDVVHQPEES